MALHHIRSDTEVTSCSKECKESYAKLKKLYDEQRAQLSDASIEIQAYTQALKKVEAQLVAHQQDQLCQMSANDKFGLGYGDHRYDGILSYENEVLQSVFMNKESDLENQPLVMIGCCTQAEGMHVVPPPKIGNYIPYGPDIEIDYSQFTYGLKQSQPSKSETQTSDFDTCESDCSVETHKSLPEPTVNKPKVIANMAIPCGYVGFKMVKDLDVCWGSTKGENDSLWGWADLAGNQRRGCTVIQSLGEGLGDWQD
ncbi:hypothetical protein Tco_0122200 [Tanacetum coccineum]